MWVLMIVLSSIFTVLLHEPIQWVFVRFFGSIMFRPQRGVKGLWNSTYTYTSGGQEIDETQIIELRQIGKYVIGRNITGKAHWQRLKGKVHSQTYFTVFWENIPEGDIYHGAFQFKITPDGERMSGQYVGFDDKYQICTGPWTWILLSRSVDKLTKYQALKDSEKDLNNFAKKGMNKGGES